MTARSRQPTDDAGATRFDPDPLHALATPAAAPDRSLGSSVGFDSFEAAATEVNSQHGFPGVERATPTDIDPEHPPIRVISMKDHEDKTRIDQPRAPLHVQLRSLAELSSKHRVQRDLGHLAPPRDPRQARARQVRRYALRVGVALGLAAAITLAIWLAAGT
jgi:hypothetical protein